MIDELHLGHLAMAVLRRAAEDVASERPSFKPGVRQEWRRQRLIEWSETLSSALRFWLTEESSLDLWAAATDISDDVMRERAAKSFLENYLADPDGFAEFATWVPIASEIYKGRIECGKTNSSSANPPRG